MLASVIKVCTPLREPAARCAGVVINGICRSVDLSRTIADLRVELGLASLAVLEHIVYVYVR